MAKKKAPKRASRKRKPGAPPKAQPLVSPEVLHRIADLRLEGQSASAIARQFGIDESTVRHHLEKSVYPLWEAEAQSRLARDLAKVEHLEKVAWERFWESTKPQVKRQVKRQIEPSQPAPQTKDELKGQLEAAGVDSVVVQKVVTKTTKTGEAVWLEIVRWCLDWRARIFGTYAPTRHEVSTSGELRLAGASPGQIDAAMIERLKEKIAERRRYELALAEAKRDEG